MYTIPQSRRFFNISKTTIPQVISGYPLIGIRRYIRFNLISIGQAVCAVEHIHYGHDLRDSIIVQPKPLHGGTMGVNSVNTVIGDRH